jgi:hypothetical protein
MWKALTADSILPCALIGMTAVTGLVDAVSFLSLGHVFTANMTGNVVLLAFASTRGTSGVPWPVQSLLSWGFLQALRLAVASWQARTQWCSFVRRVRFCIGDCLLSRGNSGRTWLWCRFISAFPTPLRDDRFHSHSHGDEKCRRT